MEHKLLSKGLVLIAILGGIVMSAGCIADTSGDDDGGSDSGSDATSASVSQDLSCGSYNSSIYTPFIGTDSPKGTVATYPWRGSTSSYPSGDEAFNGYGSRLPATVECGSDKGARKYLDVTAGCLEAVSTSSGNRGQIAVTSDGSYRSFAKGFASGHRDPVKWTDTGTEYNFYYSKAPLSVGVNPGFKAFLRYRTEYDLYVASWREDGVVQIQKKQCGVYTILKKRDLGKPSAGTWHTIKFEAVGDKLSLWLDGSLAMTVNDSTFAWGTAGIRIDSYDGSYIDNWKVYAP